MQCPNCKQTNAPDTLKCQHCGIVFTKYSQDVKDIEIPLVPINENEQCNYQRETLYEILTAMPPEFNFIVWASKAVLTVFLIMWGLNLMMEPIDEFTGGFLHYVNLAFHEAGHIVFSLFGRFLMVLGGSLMQVILPLVCFIVFLFRTRDPFGASISLWWCGESLLDLTPYINDAHDMKLTLLGGITGQDNPDMHDWQNILSTLGVLKYDHAIAYITKGVSIVIMLIAMLWAVFLVLKEYSIRASEKTT
jgi:hypothetical protein